MISVIYQYNMITKDLMINQIIITQIKVSNWIRNWNVFAYKWFLVCKVFPNLVYASNNNLKNWQIQKCYKNLAKRCYINGVLKTGQYQVLMAKIQQAKFLSFRIKVRGLPIFAKRFIWKSSWLEESSPFFVKVFFSHNTLGNLMVSADKKQNISYSKLVL